MNAIEQNNTRRPNAWFLGPAILSCVLHVLAHKDFVWVALCLALILSSYTTSWYVVWPRWRKHWPRLLAWGGLFWMLAYFYFDLWMNAGRGLNYFPRFLFKPWIVTPSSLLAAVMLVYLWHVPFQPKGRGPAVLFVSGWIVLCSAQFVGLSSLFVSILLLYCASLGLVLFLAGVGHASLGEFWLPNLKQAGIFLLCCLFLGAGTWGVMRGLRKLERVLPQFLGQFFRPPNFSGHLGSRDTTMIRRHQNIRLSSALVASFRGPAEPGYVRTRVMTRYKQGLWSSPRTSHPLRRKQTTRKHRTFYLPKLLKPTSILAKKQSPKSLLKYEVHTFQQVGNSMLLSYGTRRLVTDKEARCFLRVGHTVLCEPPHHIVEYDFYRRLHAPLTLGIGQVSPELSIPAKPSKAPSTTGKLDRQATEAIYQKLRPLARKVVGHYDKQPLLAAQVLQSYFRQNYKYSLQVRLAPKGDPTVDFVLNKRPAFCEYFASGMVLMLRSLGIRARMAAGFVVKEYHAMSGRWLVRQRDAHAWTEVYDAAHQRWVAFDPTSPNSISRSVVGGLRGLFEKWSTWFTLSWQQFASWLRRVNYREWLTQQFSEIIGALWRWQTLIVLLCLWALLEVWRLRHSLWRWLLGLELSFLPHPPKPEVLLLPLQKQTSDLVEEMLHHWAQHGLSITAGETLEEFFERLQQSHEISTTLPSASSFERWLQLYNELRFLPSDRHDSSSPLSSQHLEELQQLIQEYERSLLT